MKKIKYVFLMLVAMCVATSCSEDDLSPDSIFDTTAPQRNEFDNWILENFTTPYNIDLKYRFDDIESDMDYNVVPADYTKSVALAQMVKFLWLDAYAKLTSPEFLPTYCPKVMHFVGSPEYNAASGSMVLGTAEGGMKITLFNVNGLDVEHPDMDVLNEWYFKTMHHEFAHILHQTKNYSTDFNDITAGKYTGEGWVNIADADARKDGFVTAYGSSQPDEDFVETIANYIVKSDEEWQNIMSQAGTVGGALIQEKLDMVTEYLQDSWNIDIQALHEEVQARQAQILDRDDWTTLK